MSISLSNTSSLVNDLHFEHIIWPVIARFNRDGFIGGELERIFCQVNQHLLEANLVTNKVLRELYGAILFDRT